jgi:hypothetical protein
MSHRFWIPCTALALLALASAACKRVEDGAAAATAVPGPAVIEDKQPSARIGLETARALLGEAARAELGQAGLFIDLGTGEQHKYTLGGWKNGWGDNEIDADGTTFAKIKSRSAPLSILIGEEAPLELVARLRAPRGGQKLSVLLDRAHGGNGAQEIGEAWTVVRVPLKAGALPPGRHELTLTFGAGGKDAYRAEVDWVWLSTMAGAPPLVPVPRTLSLSLGGKARRSLVALPPRAYANYIWSNPPDARINNGGAAGKEAFSVKVGTVAV